MSSTPLNTRHLILLALLLFPPTALAQDARSFGLAGTGTGFYMGPFSVLWNPAALALSIPPGGVSTATGFSTFGTNNTEKPLLDFNHPEAVKSAKEPVLLERATKGLLAVQLSTYGAGYFRDDQYALSASQGSLQLLTGRKTGSLLSGGAYGLDFREKEQLVSHFILSFAQKVPLGSAQAAVGGNLKIHQGTRYQETLMAGLWQQGNPGGSSYVYDRWTADSGTGVSYDMAFLVKPAEVLSVGVVVENTKSDFKWKAERQSLTLDGSTGQETVVLREEAIVKAPFPHATRVGMVYTPSGAGGALIVESTRREGKTRWRFGFERVYGKGIVRLGTHKDPVSDQMLWSFGGGYYNKGIGVDIGLVTRRVPVVQESAALGGAFGLEVRF